mmetsp:Transcript_47287/g.86838  ORF Transcript_47287/g.86838 Transcript_47287/m.86838 type:complete len:289 (+) Transcript_47287:84-950(+)
MAGTLLWHRWFCLCCLTLTVLAASPKRKARERQEIRASGGELVATVLPDFISAVEADTLSQLHFNDIMRHESKGGIGGDGAVYDARKSNTSICCCGQWIHRTVARVQRRISEEVGLPLQNFEDMQLTSYLPHGKYEWHEDIDAQQESPNPRIRTVLMYLNTVYEADGGATTIRYGDEIFRVQPRVGTAVSFPSDTMHQAEVLKGGWKVVANQWIHKKERRMSDEEAVLRKYIVETYWMQQLLRPVVGRSDSMQVNVTVMLLIVLSILLLICLWCSFCVDDRSWKFKDD